MLAAAAVGQGADEGRRQGARARVEKRRNRCKGKWLEGRGQGWGRRTGARGEGTAQGARDQWQGKGHAEGSKGTKAQGQARDMTRAKRVGGEETDDKGGEMQRGEKGREQWRSRQSRAVGVVGKFPGRQVPWLAGRFLSR